MLVVSFICDKIKLEDCVVKLEVYVLEIGFYVGEFLGVIIILSFYNNFSMDVVKEIESLKV